MSRVSYLFIPTSNIIISPNSFSKHCLLQSSGRVRWMRLTMVSLEFGSWSVEEWLGSDNCQNEPSAPGKQAQRRFYVHFLFVCFKQI